MLDFIQDFFETIEAHDDEQLKVLTKYPYTLLHLFEAYYQFADLSQVLPDMKLYVLKNSTLSKDGTEQELDLAACKSLLFATIPWIRPPFRV